MYADRGPAASEYSQLQLYRGLLRDCKREDGDEPVSVIDSFGSALGHKDSKAGALASGKLEKYSWLMFSDEDAASMQKVRMRRALVTAAVVLAASVLIFLAALLIQSGKAGPSISSLMQRAEAEKEVELDLSLKYKGHELRQGVTLTVLPEKISREKAEQLFDECEQWIREQLSFGVTFPQEAPNGVAIVWQNSDFSYLQSDASEDYTLVAQLSAGDAYKIGRASQGNS